MEAEAHLKLHIEPDRSIDVTELVDALGSLSREYRSFCASNALATKAGEARLLVSSVSPGSIDINLVPDLAAGLLPILDQLGVVRKFADHIKWLLDGFLGRTQNPTEPELTIRDCDNAVNIVKPVANNGGHQDFYTVHGDVVTNILHVSATDARRITSNAGLMKAVLSGSSVEIKQRVPMVWKRLDSDDASTEGNSPDKAIIEEIDPKPKAILFTDEMADLKRVMIQDEEKPFQKVYFVDVEVSRVGDKVVSYRVVGYHGKDDL